MGFSTPILVLSVILLIFSWILSLASFAILIQMMWKKNEMKSGSNLMLLNLSAVDAIFSSYCSPFLIHAMISSICMSESGLCTAFICGLLAVGSCHLLTILMIIIRRYLSDTCNRPGVLSSLECIFDFSYNQTKSYVLPIIWVLAFSATIPVVTGLFQFQCKVGEVQCFFVSSTSTQIHAVLYCVIFFISPFLLMVVFQTIWYHSRFLIRREDQPLPRILPTKSQKSREVARLGNYTDILEEAIHSNGVRSGPSLNTSRKEKQRSPKFFVVKNKAPDKPSGCRNGKTLSTVFILFMVTTVTWCPYFAMAIKDVNITSVPCEKSSAYSEQVLAATTQFTNNCSDSTLEQSELTLFALFTFLPHLGPLLRFAVYTGKMSRFRGAVLVWLSVLASAFASLVVCFTPKLSHQSKLHVYRNILKRRVHPDASYSSTFQNSPFSHTGVPKEWRSHHRGCYTMPEVKTQTTAQKCHYIPTVSQVTQHNHTLSTTEHFNFITTWDTSRDSTDKSTVDATDRDGLTMRSHDQVIGRPLSDVSVTDPSTKTTYIDEGVLFGFVR